jgi:hypothetical protein
VLRNIFGPERDEVTGEWRRLHIEELYDLYSSPDIIRMIRRKMRWVANVVERWLQGFGGRTCRKETVWKL